MWSRVAELALLFLRLGTTAFGGPAAHVAMMEDEVVTRRGWLTRGQFLDLVGATNLIPGPNSTELAIHVGYLRAGWIGLIIAGTCFILPAALIVGVLAWVYVQTRDVAAATAVLYGVKPVVIAVVAQALWRLAVTALKSVWLGALTTAAVVAVALGANEIGVLAAAGVLAAIAHRMGARRRTTSRAGERAAFLAPLRLVVPSGGTTALEGAAAGAAAGVGLWPIFTFFLKVGSVLFGSGYVLLALLRTGLVTERGWLTNAQLLDAVAIGQMTPGPVFTTATFVGYLLAGAGGAAVATLGIFLPAFVFVAASGPLVPRIRRSPTAGAALDGVNVASLALMAVVTFQLSASALVDGITVVITAVSACVLFRYRVNSAWLVLGGGALGVLVRALGYR